jgi:hypothetical protein
MKCSICERHFSIEDLNDAIRLKQTGSWALFQFRDTGRSIHKFRLKDLKTEPLENPEQAVTPIVVIAPTETNATPAQPIEETQEVKPNKLPDWPWIETEYQVRFRRKQ